MPHPTSQVSGRPDGPALAGPTTTVLDPPPAATRSSRSEHYDSDIQLFDAAKQADPLGLDTFFATQPAVMQVAPQLLLRQLEEAVATAAARRLADPAAGLAALRDLDFLLCAVHVAQPFAYKAVPGLEKLLVALGRWTGHAPRGSNTTYGLCNPLDARMRVFTGLEHERTFVTEIHAGLRGLGSVLTRLGDIAAHGLGSRRSAAAADLLVQDWEPMVRACVAMLRSMPPQVFAGEILPCFVALDIGGTEFRGVTGAQGLNVGIDWLLWGTDRGHVSYRTYAQHGISEQLPVHRDIITTALRHTSQKSLLTLFEQQTQRGRETLDPTTVRAVLDGVAELLRRIGTFRAAHGRLAQTSLPLRSEPVGSGGHTMDLLTYLHEATTAARHRLDGVRAHWGDPS